MTLNPEAVTLLVDKWRHCLGLGTEWCIGVKINETKDQCDEDCQDALAFTQVEEAYFNADITFNAWRFKDKDDKYLELVVCHEVLHIVLHKLESLADVALGSKNEYLATIIKENTVELLSRAFVALDTALHKSLSGDQRPCN